MWLWKYTLSYSLGSILLGLLIAVLLTCVFLLVAKLLSKSYYFTPISLAIAFVLLLILSVQSVLFVASKRMSNTITDYEEQFNQIVATSNSTTEDVIEQLQKKAPVVWHFVAGTNYDKLPLTELPQVVCTNARSALNSYAWRRVWWSFGCFLVACAIIAFFENKGQKVHKNGRRQLTGSRIKFYDD